MLQDWVTVSGPTSGNVTQPEAEWVDISDFQDIAFFVEIGGNSASANLNIQTSPTKDEVFFGAKLASAGNAYLVQFPMGSTGVQLIQVVRWSNTSNNNQLPARYVRWQIAFSAAVSVSFRVWLALNQAGWRGGAMVGGGLSTSRGGVAQALMAANAPRRSPLT
jgi:hypothetical protein